MALVFQAPWEVEFGQDSMPPCGADEVVVEIAASGICGTDLAIISGQYEAKAGVILGHEAAGTIAALGAHVDDLSIGQRVTVNPTYFCGRCFFCRTGRENHCSEKFHSECGVSKDGTFARYHVNNAAFVYPLNDHVSFNAATFVEPLSCVLNAINKLQLFPAFEAMVCGGGPIGLLAAWVLSYKGLSGTLVEVSEKRRSLVADLLPPRFTVAEALDSAPDTFDLGVDTTSCCVGQLLEGVRHGGQVATLGLKPQSLTIDVGKLADRSVSLIASIDSQNNSFFAALELISSGIVPTDRFVSHTFSISDFETACMKLGCDISGRTWAGELSALKVTLTP